MNGFLQRMASNVLSPGRTIHPVIGPVFSDATDRRSSEAFQGENSTLLRTWPESPVTPHQAEGAPPDVGPELATSPPAAQRPSRPDSEPRPPVSRVPTVPTVSSASGWSEQKTSVEPGPEKHVSFKPLVDLGQQKEVEKPTVLSTRRNYEVGELVEQKDVHLREKPEPGNASRDLSRIIQTSVTGSAPPVKNILVPTVISIPSKTEQEWSAEPISARTNPLVTPAQQSALEESEVVPNSRDKPLLEEDLPRQGGATILPEISAPVTRDPWKEEKSELSRHSRLPQREPDEIQIHIGRIEVVAVPPPVASPASPKPRPGAPSLDEYLRRRNGRAV
jgi:hypothetical protein